MQNNNSEYKNYMFTMDRRSIKCYEKLLLYFTLFSYVYIAEYYIYIRPLMYNMNIIIKNNI